MKSILIAAGMAAMLLGAAPAVAAPVAAAPGIEAPQDRNWDGRDNRGYRDDARVDRRGDRWRGDRNHWRGRDHDRRWNGNRRWNSNRWCHNVRRHHRWVRVCGRR
jgi:hypothetical protein